MICIILWLCCSFGVPGLSVENEQLKEQPPEEPKQEETEPEVGGAIENEEGGLQGLKVVPQK